MSPPLEQRIQAAVGQHVYLTMHRDLIVDATELYDRVRLTLFGWIMEHLHEMPHAERLHLAEFLVSRWRIELRTKRFDEFQPDTCALLVTLFDYKGRPRTLASFAAEYPLPGEVP